MTGSRWPAGVTRAGPNALLVLPGAVVETPGWFRISLTPSDEMVERGLIGFARARERATAG